MKKSEAMDEHDIDGPFSFSVALQYLKTGSRLTRSGWNGKGMWVVIKEPSHPDDVEPSDMTLPYICMRTACHNWVPWLASQTDLLADDWVLK